MSQPLRAEFGEALLYSELILENGTIAIIVFHLIYKFSAVNFFKNIVLLPLIELRLVFIWKLWTTSLSINLC